jgi:hypothetical protein
MTRKELESEEWRLIAMAKIDGDKARRKALMQEAYDLLTRATAMRQLDSDSEEELNGGSSIEQQGYRMRLSNWDGATLWVYLKVESRADAMWVAHALAGACSGYFEDYDLWDGTNRLLSADTQLSNFVSDSALEVSIASQQSLLDTEEALLHSKVAVARSRRLLEATSALRNRLARHEN